MMETLDRIVNALIVALILGNVLLTVYHAHEIGAWIF